ncbi:MAG: hypothetical protein DMF56_09410 [Acidobacteria bacterium]|nr:MAG: hypothetical protein DMF56_09410 [Acidobacteriota bacterium]
MLRRPIRTAILALCYVISLLGVAPSALARRFELRPNATSTPPSDSHTRPGTPMDELLRRAAGHPIYVIVGLKLDREWVPDGLLDPIARSNQHAAIALAMESFRNRYADRANLEIRDFSPIPYVSFMADVDLLVRLNLDYSVASIEANDSGSGGLHQTATKIGATTAWTNGFVGTGRTVAIIDSGVEKTHPFFGEARFVAEACYSSSFASNPRSASVCPNGHREMTEMNAGVNCNATISGCWHGTHVAGIAAGSSDVDNIWGIAKGANIISIQVYHANLDASDCNGDPAPCAQYFNIDLLDALKQVHTIHLEHPEYKITAVNMSLQQRDPAYPSRFVCRNDNPSMQAAVTLVISDGIAVVGITGNYGNKNALFMPGCLEGVIDVGATTKDDTVWSFSDSHAEMNLLAPGDGNAANVGITSSVLNRTFDWARGTSMAAPHVTGALALLKQKSPNASIATLLQDLVSTGVPITDTNGVTKPRINVWSALTADHTAPTTPAGLTATATSTTTVVLSWNAAADEHGVSYYSIERRATRTDAFLQIDTANSPIYTDHTVTAQTTYQYRIVALDTSSNASAPSNLDLATTVSYSDDPLTPTTTVIRAAHITDLRAATNSIRTFALLTPAAWTDVSLVGIAVKVDHVQELRARLGEAFSAIGLTPPSYTDPTLTPNTTAIRAVHFTELQGNTK